MCVEGEPKTLENLTDDCAAFCQVDGQDLAIPVLLGTPRIGFSQKDMDGLCFGTGEKDVMVYDKSKLDRCRSSASSFAHLQKAAANFIKEVEVFESSQDLYRARMKDESNKLQKTLNS